MNCYLHPESTAVAYCRTCGRALCAICQRPAEGTIFCQDHVPVPVYAAPAGAAPPPPPPPRPAGASAADYAANPYLGRGPIPTTAAAPVRTSPGLAFVLGFIPGVGAIYNGQYLKGLVHALLFGLFITIIDNSPGNTQPLVGILLAAFVFYMPFEAYHTAKQREQGVVPDEWSSILPRGTQSGRAPVGPILLIALGVLYLLNSLDLVNFRQIGRFWPVLLIAVGAYMLYTRVTGSSAGTHEAGAPPNARPANPPAPGDWMGSGHE